MLKNIFSSYLYEGKCDVSLTKFKKHILETRKKNKQGIIISNSLYTLLCGVIFLIK